MLIVFSLFDSTAGFFSGSAFAAASPIGEHSCRLILFENIKHTVCEIDLRYYRIDLHWADEKGRPYGALAALEQGLARQGRKILISMNAGMYQKDLSPLGLFIKDGLVQQHANLRAGAGNFYLKPNGVFFVRGKKAGVMETKAFLQKNVKADIATQSGPLLVIKGRLHSRFLPDSNSKKIRNGIGVRADGIVMLAISEEPTNFDTFARLFRDALKCPDALYLDGSVSQVSIPGYAPTSFSAAFAALVGKPLGPILSFEKY